jgi:hypothetical protein
MRKWVKTVTATIDNKVNKSFVLRQGDKPELLTGDIELHFRQICEDSSGLEPQLSKFMLFSTQWWQKGCCLMISGYVLVSWHNEFLTEGSGLHRKVWVWNETKHAHAHTQVSTFWTHYRTKHWSGHWQCAVYKQTWEWLIISDVM